MVDQTKFNMSAATLQRLDELLRKATHYYSVGQLNKFFFSLKNTKLQSMFKFSKTERGELRKLEKDFYKAKDKKFKWGNVERYNEKLLDLMNKYGLLLPDKVDDLNTTY